MNNLDLTKLAQQIKILRHWIDVQQIATPLSAERSMRRNLEVWRETLDELSTCQEALHQQHEQLIVALQTVEEERQRYRDLFDLAPDGFIVTDTIGVVRQANEAAATLLGKPKQWLVDKLLILFVTQEKRREFRMRLHTLATAQRRHEWEAQLQSHNRTSFYVSMIVSPVFDAAGKVSSLLWLIRDISAQKWAEEELRKASHELAQQVTKRTAQLIAANEALRIEITARQQAQAQLIETERLAVLGITAEKVAHEIGNTLNNLSTTVQLQRYHINAQPSLRDATLAATMQDSQQQLLRLHTIVQGWRSLAQQSQLHLESMNLYALLSEELDSHARRAADQNVTVVRDLPGALPPVKADREKLQCALRNVYANALNAMPTGGTLTVRVSHAGEYVYIEVGDTGPSLPAGTDLFDLFTTTLPPGVGLGLAIAERIINAHGGQIINKSDPNVGTLLCLTLPVER